MLFHLPFKKSKRSKLVIDDDEEILRVSRRIFEKNGYSVSTAKTGGEAKQMLGMFNYDVTLVDLTLPDMHGSEIL